ncbi:hypothetical protein VQL36_19290 [Chengkuizengella sp. SCS-71B]|uniref:XkdQ/YqbQ family protein n=1 Tax=Chengkuizengella sp. SCS-71B TaxID=3115290 RepID=UPI0032C22260
MDIEVIIDNRDGNVWDISELVSNMKWKTKRIGSAGKLEFTLLNNGIYQSKSFKTDSGDIVEVRAEGKKIFKGYIFKTDRNKDRELKVLAYDQIRYLMMNDTYVFSNVTATQIIQQIASDFQLQVGELEDTEHKVKLVEDNQKLLDIINKALDFTLIATGKNFVLYDDVDQLTLKNIESLAVDISLGNDSLMYDYKHSISIEDSYNQIKVVQDNKETGRRDVYIIKDSETISEWGLLQFYKKVENMNPAQIEALTEQLAELKNREQKKLKVEAMGDLKIRAGSYVPIFIEELGIGQNFLIDECTHQFEGNVHTMKLELKVIEVG